MAYENFQVCKEIYVPISDAADDISLDEYKAKYGIDLRDLFTFDSSGIHIKPQTKRNKIYAYTNSGVYALFDFYDPDNDVDCIGAIVNYGVDFVGESVDPYGSIFLTWDDGDQLLKYREI